LWPTLRISIVGFPVDLRDNCRQWAQDCAVGGRWLRLAFLIPGAAALLAIPVELELAGQLPGGANDIVIDVAWFLTGAVAFIAASQNRAARWLLAGTSMALLGKAVGYSPLAHPGSGWEVIVLVEALSWFAYWCALGAFVLFPDGLYQRPYERWVMVVSLPAVVPLLLVQLTGLDGVRTHQLVWAALHAPNPFYTGQLHTLAAAAQALINNGGVLLLIGLLLMMLRYRRFGPEQRRQIRWPLFSIGLTVGLLELLGFLPGSSEPYAPAQIVAWTTGNSLLPIGFAVGILNYRALDIDTVIRRSVVYGILWLSIAAAYIALAATFGIAVGQRVPLGLAVLLTIIATLVFQPARRRLERVADRVVFGRRLNGYELISQLGARLESSVAPEDVAGTVAAAVRSGLSARWVRVELNDPDPRPVAAVGIQPREVAEASLSAPLIHGELVVGRIECGPKLDGGYNRSDQDLLTMLGRQAALSIRNSQLTAELSDRLEELGASRIRLVQADDAARRRLERDLHDGVQQQLVGLLTRLGLARNQLRRDAALTEATLREAQVDAQRALESVQELARGIHPAILTDRGLIEAVKERATRMTVPVEVSTNGVPVDARFSAELEGAAYFFVSEALANVVKHADATRVQIRFHTDIGRLVVDVEDDGFGFDAGAVKHSGLRGLRDRIEAQGGQVELATRPGQGTALKMTLPVARSPHA